MIFEERRTPFHCDNGALFDRRAEIESGSVRVYVRNIVCGHIVFPNQRLFHGGSGAVFRFRFVRNGAFIHRARVHRSGVYVLIAVVERNARNALCIKIVGFRFVIPFRGVIRVGVPAVEFQSFARIVRSFHHVDEILRALIYAVDVHVHFHGNKPRVNGEALRNVFAREGRAGKFFVFIPVRKGVIPPGNRGKFHLSVFCGILRGLLPFGRFVVFHHESNFEIVRFVVFFTRRKQSDSCK